jgi:SAM domain (Sterile alpha motif)
MSRSDSPELVSINESAATPVHSRHSSREETSPAFYYTGTSIQTFGGGGGREITTNGLQIMPVVTPSVATQVVAVSTATPPNVLSASASVETVTQWLSRNRYSSLLGNFRNYNGRDLLRLSREDVISMCGLSDGIRLYNDLHMAVVAPRTTFYVALKDTHKYDAIFLEELTVAEFIRRFALCVGLQPQMFSSVYKRVPQGFLVRVTNEVIQYTSPESVFYFTLKQSEDGSSDKCDIILEDAVQTLIHDPLKSSNPNLDPGLQS